ncbi:hypothetical protein ACFW89_36110, partial [Streptomyces albidoflavus]
MPSRWQISPKPRALVWIDAARSVEVGAVGDEVGVLETAEVGVTAQVESGDLLAGERVHHDELRRGDGGAPYGVEDAEFLQRQGSVRCQLQAGSDLAEAGGALHHGHAVAQFEAEEGQFGEGPD